MLRPDVGSASPSSLPMLLFRVGTSLCALPLASVGETMRPLPVEPLPDTADFVLGLAIVRGAPTPVIDLAVLLGLHDGSRAERFVTLRLGERTAMLAVSAVVGVRRVDEQAMAALPPLAGGLAHELVRKIGVLDHALLAVLQSGALVPESLWGSLEGAA
jgi:purine-binding chemotaxis protein CheW